MIMFAQLLLLQSAFSLHNPLVPCNGTHMPSLSLAIMQTFPVSHCEFKVHDAQTLFALQYPVAQFAFVAQVKGAEGVHAALHLARQADWHSPTVVVSAFVTASPVFAAAGLAHTLLVHSSPVAHGEFAEHDCPAVLGAACVMHLPVEHTLVPHWVLAVHAAHCLVIVGDEVALVVLQ